MRYLLDIHHPKHAHLFRASIERWLGQGDRVRIVTRDKDVTHALLDAFGFEYKCLSRQSRGWRLPFELVRRWVLFAREIRRFRPDVTISSAGVTTAPPSWLLGIPTIALTDTETAALSNRIAFPFADIVATPSWYARDHGSRHRRFDSFLEWSYLHPSRFTPDPEIVRAEGVDPDEPYAVARLVRWDAAHDRGQTGFSGQEAARLVTELAKRMRVHLTSEAEPPPELAPYKAKFRVENIHHVVAHARMIVGESPSMSAEAALMGVPSVLASSWAGQCGNMRALEERFGLMRTFSRGSDAVDAALALADQPPARADILASRERLVRELENMPDVIDRLVTSVTSGRSRA